MEDLIASRFRHDLSSVTFRNWILLITREYLQWSFLARCSRTGVVEERHGRKWRLSPHMTKSELVQTAFKAALTAVEHETREKFLYRGEAIFGPHYDVDKLVELCRSGEAEEHRHVG